MLIFSRKEGEKFMIGDDIEVTIVRVDSDKIRIGITAPKEVPVFRQEIYDVIQRDKLKEQTK